MATSTITWTVLARDVGSTIRVQDAERLVAAMVLDADTGLVRGVAIAETLPAALQQAFTAALTKPAADLPPGPPARVLFAAGLADAVRDTLAASDPDGRASLVEVQPDPEAEDLFDSLLGHLAGREQPEEPPTPGDWELLIAQAATFRRAEPWIRWSDEHDLHVRLLPLNAPAEPYVAIVMGQAGVQRGLALYPGDHLPPGMRDQRSPEHAPPPPAGTLLLTLDPPDEPPVEFAAKAVRYGWPRSDDLLPVFIGFTPAGAAEIGRADARRLAAGIAAVLAFDGRGPTSADAAGRPVTGSVTLADGRPFRFEVENRPSPPEPEPPSLRLHVAGQELVPVGTPITLGHLTWDGLSALRTAAGIYRPAPADAPAPAGHEIPLVVLSPGPGDGPSVAAKIAELDPYGVAAVDAGDGDQVLVLAGGNAAEVLLQLPPGQPALAAFHRRMRQTNGRHVVMVADMSSAAGEGAVYGLFECHQPPAAVRQAGPGRSAERARGRPTGRGKKKRR